MPINASPEYVNAESEYYNASTDEEKVLALENMIKTMPTHKGAENLRKNLRTRYKKFKQDLAKSKKAGKGKKGIKKADMQVVIVGLTNSGKSSILKSLTNAKPRIASYGFTTKKSEIGTLNYEGCPIQIIDLPPIASKYFDKSLVNSADTLILVIEKIEEIKTIKEVITKLNKKAKEIIVFNKIDSYDNKTKRKISETLKSKKYNFVITSTETNEGIDDLKKKILESFNILRIYTRKPGKKQDSVPVIMKPNSNIKDVAEKILHGYSKKVKYAKITGPSSKFSNQRVGLKHNVKDRDVVEFFTD